MIDTKTILYNADLASLVESSLGQPGKRSGHWLFWHCPFHPGDQTPSLGVNQEQRDWFCFGCRKGGDAITWLVEYQGLTFQDACKYLAAGNETRHVPSTPAGYGDKPHPRYPDALQESWKTVIEECEKRLWQPEGNRAREYLHQRGIKDSTLQNPFFRVGYSPGFKVKDVWVDRGIVLPCFTTTKNMEIKYIHYIKIRRPSGEPKYKKLPGHGAKLSGLYGAKWALGADVLFITEGEFDALLLWQEAKDLVGVCTLGGAGDRFDFAAFGRYLLAARYIFIAYDNDPAGQKGGETWKKLSGRVLTVHIPTGKDLTEYWQAGGDLAAWVMDSLTTYGIE